MLRKTLFTSILVHAASMLAFGATVTLQPAADTSLFENGPDNNLGATDLASGTIRIGPKSRALIRFDLAGQVPANATIMSAEFRIRVSKAPPGGAPSTFGLHRVLQSWTEGSKGGIVGSPATAGESTWNARVFPDTPWSAPGAAAPADYAAKASATRLVSGLNAYTFASTPDLVADVQAWVANPASNFGWILISQSEGTPLTARRFASRETPSNGPTLVIQFTAPAQATPPAITAQPQSQAAVAGSSVTFTVTATGTEPLGYQWKFNNTDVAGATSPTLTLNNVQAANAGSYTVTVSNAGGSLTSSGATLTVTSPTVPPTITVQPASQSVVAGANVTFTVTATGTEPLSYQWKFNNTDLAGATNPTLTLNNVQAANAGSYTVAVSNVAGSATSATATLTVTSPIVPPTITVQPQSQSVVPGASATLTVTATGTAPLSYQWKFNGADIPNATSPSLVLNSVQPANAGSYTVVVTNAVGSATSVAATLTVLVPPSITQQPSSQTANAGGPVTFQVTAVGTVPLSYQWKFNGSDIAGATGPTLALANVQTINAGSYTVVVSNSAGSVTSAPATLTVLVPPSITQHPKSQTVDAGVDVTLAVSASGSEPLSYQWRFNGNPLAGATSSSLVLTNVQPDKAGSYSAVVSNPAGSVISDAAVLTVNTVPEQPPRLDRINLAGSNVTLNFTVQATYELALEFSNSLVAASWTTLTNVSAKVAPLNVTVTDSISGSPQKFYRLKVTGRVR